MMLISPQHSSQWMTEFQKELLRAKQVLLYGNVADMFLLNGRYLSLGDFLNTYFREEGYNIVSTYDIADGLRLADPSVMQPIFDRILMAATGGDVNAVTPAVSGPVPADPRRGGAAAVQGAQPVPQRGVPRAAAGPGLMALRAPDQALHAIRVTLAQTDVSAAAVIDFSDKLVGDPERQIDAERLLMVQLKKAIREAAYITAGSLAGRKNALVIVASQLGAVPPWLYQDEPFLALVQVGRPRTEERINFLRSYCTNFHGGEALSGDELDRVAQDFSDLTDGLMAWDMEAIRRTSVAEGLSVSNPKALVDYYKYGQRDDPWEHLDQGRVSDACTQIEKRVIGQPAAVEAVVDMLLSARVGLTMSGVSAKAGKPKGTLFFVGPTGVGKTELAKALAGVIFGDDTAFARFDMSEYAEQHAAEKLTGSPPGYVGYEEGGQLTNRVRERPFSILLFDEIEKAHGRVMDKFLQILEDGRLTDGKGQTAYFSQTVIIFTSNIGSDTLDLRCRAEGGDVLPYDEVRKHYLAAVHDHFVKRLGRPEILNRLGDNILVFDLLRPQHIEGICNRLINSLVASAREKRGLELIFPDGRVVEMISRLMLNGDNLLFGGRRIKSLLEHNVERSLNRWIFFNNPAAGTTLKIVPADDDQGIQVVL